MNDYYRVRIDVAECTEDITDLAAAYLADAGFESFEPDSTGLTAYIKREAGDGVKIAEESLSDFPMESDFKITGEVIEGEDWNEEWEKNYFKPILIEGRCVIHSTFHREVPEAEYDIVIDPKMAFGTGHHDTTSQMVKHILDLPLQGKSVIDMGTGTGILGILAAMRGAERVIGIEIDEAAYENAKENVTLNGVKMELIHGDATALSGLEPADYLFANINRNIILGDIDRYAGKLKSGGEMLLSGFYDTDIAMIAEAASRYDLREETRLVSDARWVALRLIKE
ncbi:MAG: 50S ribosomal protein L11 methyltransferase [Muribaculaceae bacterium]|nr:50S ribosomal protein L11 methyltransferase [Muribaculaceae bacterium]MDY5387472.1 50S ribosomal protein L11 methyltransferase [Muribaculaceae bacterium]